MKRVLLVDAVESPEERPVEQWFRAYLNPGSGVDLRTLPARSPALTAEAAAADAIIVSGSPRDAWSDTPEVLGMLDFVQGAASRRQPILGVCFGHQLLGRALGADVRRNPAGWEVGARSVALTTEGASSALFAGFDAQIFVIESHRDAVLTLPSRAKLLAVNGHTPIQAFSVEDRFFGVQFHPEMDGEILRQVWTERRDRLRGEVGFDLDAALDSADADASRVLINFVRILP